MAAFDRPTEATYAIHEMVTVDTTDRKDHTFCGIMFPIRCKQTLPVNHIVINSISVRGRLGPLTVWVNKDSGVTNYDNNNNSNNNNNQGSSLPMMRLVGRNRTISSISMKKKDWVKVYEKDHKPSPNNYCELSFGNDPIILKPGQVRGIYVHSTLRSDDAIVYDNKQKEKTHDDHFISLYPGRAHVSEKAFGTVPMWGWGNSWRDNREFVGRLNYGVVYRLWNPLQHYFFGSRFQTATKTLFACQRRYESPISRLPDDCIFYILNMCRWDWVKDDPIDILQEQKKRAKSSLAKQQLKLQQEKVFATSEIAATAPTTTTDNNTTKNSTNCAETTDRQAVVAHNNDQNYDTDMHHSDSSSDDDEYIDSSDDDDDDGYNGNGDHTASSNFYYSYLDEFAESEDEEENQQQRLHDDTNRYRSWIYNQISRLQVVQTLVQDNGTTNNNNNVVHNNNHSDNSSSNSR